ncbi:MAG TPA: hypothetical protein PLI05_01440 [Methanotrichaceae archaeon]|nr:hypothetical protein [Methanotrichaceae archaeon]HQF15715.1 hypothetical protein [Methanotrichaceae archaeon]HQI90612.1 hypothetical protein [Methanotrichaceae archaeon]
MSIEAYTGYISGAAGKEDYLSFIRAAGFQEVSVSGKTVFPLSPELQDMASRDGSVEMDGKALVASIGKSAKKPGSSIGSHF